MTSLPVISRCFESLWCHTCQQTLTWTINKPTSFLKSRPWCYAKLCKNTYTHSCVKTLLGHSGGDSKRRGAEEELWGTDWAEENQGRDSWICEVSIHLVLQTCRCFFILNHCMKWLSTWVVHIIVSTENWFISGRPTLRLVSSSNNKSSHDFLLASY